MSKLTTTQFRCNHFLQQRQGRHRRLLCKPLMIDHCGGRQPGQGVGFDQDQFLCEPVEEDIQPA